MFEQYRDIMTIAEVSKVLGVGRNRIYELLSSGELKGFRIGRMWKVPKESVELYVRNSIENQSQSKTMISPVKRV